MPLILSGNVATATADAEYSVANSCRFNDGDTAYMHKTCSSAFDTDRWTISVWCKRSTIGIETRLVSCDNDSGGSDDDILKFQSDDTLQFVIYGSSSYVGHLITNAKYRDVSAWYHIVATWDSANGVAGNRMRLYVNGTEVTSFSTDTNPTSGANATFGNTSHPIEIGRRGLNNTQYWDGYMAEVAVCDGQAYAASDFGEFDEDSPTIWKPKDVSALTFGTSGFYLDFEDSANLGNDANGGTDFTEVNLAATDQAVATPTNSFCTLNPLDKGADINTTSEGNLKATWNSNNGHTIRSTMAVNNGKWYWETANADNLSCGIVSTEEPIIPTSGGLWVGSNGFGSGNSYGYGVNDGLIRTNSVSSSYGETVDNSEILGCALDLDNGRIYWSVDGVWQNSGNPEDGTNPAYTGIETGGKFFSPAWGFIDTGSDTLSVNFGNPPYANSSDAADADGYGAFEYAPPSGYYALNTKNLGAYGG